MSEDTAEADVNPRVLVVEDEEIVRDILLKVLSEEGYRVDAVETGEEGLKALDSQLYDLVLLDLNLPGMHGLNVLSAAPATQTDAQFIVMTAFGTVDTAVEAMRLGAYDYINKPFRTEELLLTLKRAREEADLRREVAQLRRRAGEQGPGSKMVGRSAPMQRLFDLMERVAPTRATVLITGETGTGKELVARGIHDLSDRARRPFVAINCSALPEGLLESELFGHMKGSFTGAIQSKRGLFEEAAGGTLFLDEVSTVSSAIQVKLLRVLQERKVKRVGGRELIPVDFRLIAATNRNLAELVDENEFREDLFYRLNVFPIEVPDLKGRREDIPVLANYLPAPVRRRERGRTPGDPAGDPLQNDGLRLAGEREGAGEFHRAGGDHARRCQVHPLRSAPGPGAAARAGHPFPLPGRALGPGKTGAGVHPGVPGGDPLAPGRGGSDPGDQPANALPEAEEVQGGRVTGGPSGAAGLAEARSAGRPALRNHRPGAL